MLEWDVLEDEANTSLPDPEEEAPPARARWRIWLLVVVLLLAGVGSMAWGWLYAQERQVRADLSEIVTQEAHLMALGAAEQAEELIDPVAPAEWKSRYRRYLGRPQSLPGTPDLRDVDLQQEGTLALVVVAWPATESAAGVVERRAYRFYRGQWRRTPLPAEGEPLQTAQTEHFVLRAGPSDLALLTQEPAYHERLETLWQHLDQSWEGWEIEQYPITIVVQRLEFESVVSYTSSRRMLRANSPRLTYVISNEPLPSHAYYELHLTRAILRRLLPFPSNLRENSLALQGQLMDAEARHWMLDAGQRRALRNSWRSALGGQWYSPLLPPPVLTEDSSEAERATYERWGLSTALFLDYLVENKGQEVPGKLAAMLRAMDFRLFSEVEWASLYLSVVGGSFEELEARAQEFALAVEE